MAKRVGFTPQTRFLQESRMREVLSESAAGDLGQKMLGNVITPEDATYDDARRVWNGTIDRRPALIARCLNEQDVAAAIAFARTHALVIAVRGGGHSFPGYSVCDGGLVIDLSLMRKVEVDAQKRRAKAQGGALWSDFDAATHAHGLATPGGAVSHTGIGGLTLGGGIGWLSRRHGLTCDNMVGATVVTADGRVVHASENANSDLLWALRGGGGNFGVVTEFEYQLHPIEIVNLSLTLFAPEDGRRVLEAYAAWSGTAPESTGAIFLYMHAPPAPFIPKQLHFAPVWGLAAVSSADTPEEAAAASQPVRGSATPVFEMATPMPYPVVQRMLDDGSPQGSLTYQKAQWVPTLNSGAIDALLAAAALMPSPMAQIHVWNVGGAVARVADDATPFGNRGSQHMVDVVGIWLDSALEAPTRAWTRATFDSLKPFGSGAYVNFISEDDSERTKREAYGEARYARLSTLKRQYDPENIFRLNQNIRPA
jgi:FAD/FMN-containing dehydrogenase